jgi:MerR family copper efflux transcriptional regulator
MNIGAAAQLSGLPAKTIRYYEDSGLIRPAARAGNGYRDYSDKDIHKLRFVKHARELGFTVQQCAELLSLYEDQNRHAADVKALASKHLGEIDSKLADLSRLRETLSHLVSCCAGDHRPDCPIIDGLAAAEPAFERMQ